MRVRILFLVILFLFVSHAPAQEVSIKIEELKPVALRALETLKNIVSENNFMRMGFKSVQETKTAQLGTPFQEFTIELGQLKTYEPGANPEELLDGGHIAYFPVNVQTETRSSIMIVKEKDQWKTVSYGSANLIQLLASTRSRLQRTTGLPISSFFVVRIPAMNLYFVGYRLNQQLMLTPILDNTGYKFKSGTPTSGDEVFRILLPHAKAHDGLPG
jgi:hypothetical protein